ncbi:LGFP repeat-containing protein [Kineococcus rubinsiae]|uniref:LGFP repeat-containing protein n=1 Tax=Kineococcus rubinsiae TaxID=2609562 RepID=UPI00143061C0|nr:hypothetical protein [Kineococcus rubinsiae]NIZ91638.1 hypothetical protein [Kineococcus rubinsiae]
MTSTTTTPSLSRTLTTPRPLPGGGIVKVFRPTPPVDLHALFWKPFEDAVARLGGAPGAPLSPGSMPEPAGEGTRVRYQDGTVYRRKDGGTAWVHGAIEQRYDQLGGATSWLGLPLADEAAFPDDGRISTFEHGSIYFWGDTGAIDLREVVVTYSGLLCFGETDWDGDPTPSEDEPYVLFGLAGPAGQVNTRSQIYSGVDAGEARPDRLELYRGQPCGLVLAATLMEHDFGDPEKFKPLVEEFVTEASKAVAEAVVYVPVVGPVLGEIAQKVLPKLEPVITDFLNALLDTGDDTLGNAAFALSARDMVVLAARTAPDVYYGVVSKRQSELLGGGAGASYKVCLGVDAV